MEEEIEEIDSRPPSSRRTFSLRNNAARQVAINFMPSRQLPGNTIRLKRNASHNALLEEVADAPDSADRQADIIVRELEQHSRLMEDNPEAEELRREALRDLAQGLTMKRHVRAKLSASVSLRSKSKPISFFKRFKYRMSFMSKRTRDRFRDFIFSIELWYEPIRAIEGHFGSAVGSYFYFLRWLFMLDALLASVLVAFVVVPQALHDDAQNGTVQRGFLDFVSGKGGFEDSLLFYGHYHPGDVSGSGPLHYNMPFAYFFTMICLYLMFFALLCYRTALSYRRNFIETARIGGMSHVFASKVFCGWDFGITTREAKALHANSIYNEFKELLNEQNKKQPSKSFCTRFGQRLANTVVTILVLALIIGLEYGFLLLLQRESKLAHWEILVSMGVTVAVTVCPLLFDVIVKLEYYKPRTAVYVTLARTCCLDIGTLMLLMYYWASSGVDCWETAFGQEAYRLVLLDAIISLAILPIIEFVRAYIFKLNPKSRAPEFNIVYNSLTIIYNQGVLWFGMLFSPLLVVAVAIKFLALFYVKRECALRACQPARKVTTFNIVYNSLTIIYNQGVLWFGMLFSPLLVVAVAIKFLALFYVKRECALRACQPARKVTTFNIVYNSLTIIYNQGVLWFGMLFSPLLVVAVAIKFLALFYVKRECALRACQPARKVTTFNIVYNSLTIIYNQGVLWFGMLFSPLLVVAVAIKFLALFYVKRECALRACQPARKVTTFNIVYNSLTIIYNQGVLWFGMLFSPLLVVAVAIKFLALFYVKRECALRACQPARKVTTFNIVYNSLTIIYNQGVLWFGMLFSPLLVVAVAIKFLALFYVKRECALRACQPARKVTTFNIVYNSLTIIYNQGVLWFGMLFSPLLVVAVAIKFLALFYVKRECALRACQPARKVTTFNIVYNSLTIIYNQGVLWFGMLFSPLLVVAVAIKFLALFYVKRECALRACQPARKVTTFNIVYNSLTIIYNQGVLWFGMLFSPLLVVAVAIKFLALFYVKRECALRACQPARKIWRAAQTQTVLYMLVTLSLFTTLFGIGTLFLGTKSQSCGPFQQYETVFSVFTEGVLKLSTRPTVRSVLVFVTRPGVIGFLALALCVWVYYMRAKAKAQHSMVEILRHMLLLQAKDKDFLLNAIAKVSKGEWMYSPKPEDPSNSHTWKYLNEVRKPSNADYHFDASRLNHSLLERTNRSRPNSYAPERSKSNDDGDTDSSFSWQGSNSCLNKGEGEKKWI